MRRLWGVFFIEGFPRSVSYEVGDLSDSRGFSTVTKDSLTERVARCVGRSTFCVQRFVSAQVSMHPDLGGTLCGYGGTVWNGHIPLY
jgi:hypothetical protein